MFSYYLYTHTYLIYYIYVGPPDGAGDELHSVPRSGGHSRGGCNQGGLWTAVVDWCWLIGT